MVPCIARHTLLKQATVAATLLLLAYLMAPSSQFVPTASPPEWTDTPQLVLATADELIAESVAFNDYVAAIETPTIENVLLKGAELENNQSLRSNMITFYLHVSASKELREASTEATRKLEESSIEQGLRLDVYQVYKKLLESVDKKQLDPETYRLLEKTCNSFKRNGLDLSEEKRDALKRLQVEHSNVCNDILKNLNDEADFLVFTKEELDGVPQDAVDLFEKVDGGYKMTFKYPDVLPVLKYATNQDVRKRAYVANSNKCSGVNSELMERMIHLRFQMAKLMGYDCYSDYVLEDRLAKSKATVVDFLGDLRTKLRPLGEAELARLKEFKNKDLQSRGLPAQDEFYMWDNLYYQNLQLEREYQVDDQKISEYFPLVTTINKMISFYEKLFDVRLIEETHPDPKSVWHPDTKLFAVYQNIEHGAPKNQFMGWLYMDLHPRDGKFSHAANFNLAAGYQLAKGRHTVVTALVCNFTKPTKTKPSLLKHSEVTTLFHELGHGIHNLLSQTKFARFHGTLVPWDFVETPSQMLEFWTWSKDELRALTSHYETGEPISDDLIDLLIKSKHVNTGLQNLRQLQFGLFDMEMHTINTTEVDARLDLLKLWNYYVRSVSLMATDGIDTKGFASFGHIAGGYGSGYYGYMYSLVFANDIYYTLFKEDPMNVANGLKYRDAILRPGNSREIMDGLREVLGREPNSDAFLQEILGN